MWQKCGVKVVPLSRLHEWASKNQWHNRATAYDDHIEEIKRFRQEEEIKEMAARHTREAQLFQDKAIERLKELDINNLKPQDVIRFYEDGVKIERLSRGVPTENIKQEQELKEVKNEISTEALKNPETRRIASKLIKQLADSKARTNRAGMGSN